MFFNLFSKAKPFAAILIAHGTHGFLGRTPEAKSGGRVVGEGQ